MQHRFDSSASFAAEAEQSLLRLKASMARRFPEVKSSHRTEAIAAGFGYKSHAAFLAQPDHSRLISLEHSHLAADKVHKRLVDLGYPVGADFSFGPPPPSPTPPARHLRRLEELQGLNYQSDPASMERKRTLNLRCAAEFGSAFGLGTFDYGPDDDFDYTWRVGVDHGSALPGWGETVSSRAWVGDFPGTDHRRSFYQPLPLTNGKRAMYTTGFVSMPYGASKQMAEAALMAGRIGWTCTRHDEWSWYMPGHTVLVLYRRATPHEAMLRAWDRSFKRWLVENRPRLRRGSEPRRFAVDDLIACSSLPFDIKDYDDLRHRYLKEFAPHLYRGDDEDQVVAIRRLMGKWAVEWPAV